MRNVLPDWAVRLLVGTLLLPAFLTALDGFFRVRRRHLAGPAVDDLAGRRPRLPVLLAWAVGAGARAHRRAGAAGRARCCRCRRSSAAAPWRSARSPSCSRSAGSASGRCCSRAPARAGARPRAAWPPPPARVLCMLAAVVWAANPYAAALLLPAAHLWLFAAAPQTRLVGWWGVAAIVAGLLPLALRGVLLHARARARPARARLDDAAQRRLRPALGRPSPSWRRRCSPASRR